MRTLPFEHLLRWALGEYRQHGSIFGLHGSLFYLPRPAAPFRSTLFGHPLGTPFGPAAGPHTQLAQNIACAWLSGGRFIELKTVQILDELEIPRPCIDMEDEGYNVEWSQELKLEQSAEEMVKAWVLVHVLHRLLGFHGDSPETIFNMSVGYNLSGIQSPPMLRFMDRLQDATAEVAALRDLLRARFPQYAGVPIPSRITDSVTLSTMHGCPPDEIERIARFLLEERGLHTTVKLNPTLLGREAVLRILHEDLGFRELQVPASAFEHDLKWDRAVALIRTLQQAAARCGLSFGVKLSNTLAMANHKDVLPGGEMYLSGRPLYPVTMNLFHRLMGEFGGSLSVSYSAGADAWNVVEILAAGARPVTAASDLLKPGGTSRMVQWIENLEAEMQRRGASSLDDLARDRLPNLERAAAAALRDPRYKKAYFPYGLPKVESALEPFDCIAAPCVDQCAVCQDVPGYAWWIAQGEFDRALEVILSRNPLPAVTGHVCPHLCQTRCTRNNYDEPVAIRALKRFAAEQGGAQPAPPAREGDGPRVAVIGSGPSGLAAAYFLALSGVRVTLFEARDRPGGMLALAPRFRLPPEAVQADVDRILGLGVELRLNQPITRPPEELLRQGFDAVYVASGFQRDNSLRIRGEAAEGVYPALRFLERVARGERPSLGSQVWIVGGGNTAVDAARTARRLTGQAVTVLYRRTRAEMPCEPEELEALLEEGIGLQELVSPRKAVVEGGRLTALECARNALGEPGPDGRRTPVPVEGSRFEMPATALIVAVGQQPDLAFLDGSGIAVRKDGSILVDPASGRATVMPVYAGGDAVRGPATIVEACADGRRAAEAICRELGLISDGRWRPAEPGMPDGRCRPAEPSPLHAHARKHPQHRPEMLPAGERGGFDLVERTLPVEAARAEAARCLQCSTLCDKCVEVCPNRANLAYAASPARWTLPVLSFREGRLVPSGREEFEVRQQRQILHLHDLCNECGNCTTFCVHQGRPHAGKPRLFLQEAAFEAALDNAYFIQGSTIRRRDGGQVFSLTRQPSGGWLFETGHVRLRLLPDLQVEEALLLRPFEGELSLRPAAEMALLLAGVTESLPFVLDREPQVPRG